MTPLLWKVAGGAAVLLAILAGVWFVYHKGETAGSAAVTNVVQQTTIEVQRKMDDAQAHGPRTQSDAIKRLRDHTF